MKEDRGVNGVDADRSGLKRVEEGTRRRGTEPLKEERVLTKGSRESEELAGPMPEHPWLSMEPGMLEVPHSWGRKE